MKTKSIPTLAGDIMRAHNDYHTYGGVSAAHSCPACMAEVIVAALVNGVTDTSAYIATHKAATNLGWYELDRLIGWMTDLVLLCKNSDDVKELAELLGIV